MNLADRIADLATQGYVVRFEFNPILDTIHVSVRKDRWIASTDVSLVLFENAIDKNGCLVKALNDAANKL